MTSNPTRFLYCGSADAGLFLSTFDEKRKEASPFLPAAPSNSFFLAVHPGRPLLYSVDISRGVVSAYAIGNTGGLTLINEVDSRGKAPCHLALDAAGRSLLVANYNGGIAAFQVRPDDGLTESTASYQPVGSGPDPRRQNKSYPHGIAIPPGGDLAYVADLGIDQILALRLGDLALVPELSVAVEPGAGPRHLAIHRSGAFAVAVNELNNTVTSFRRDPSTGKLTETGSHSTLPPGFCGSSWTAEVEYHPVLEICYATNRGHDSLAVFSLDLRTGGLQPLGIVESGGQKPQHLAFDASGETLFVANTGSNALSLFRLEKETGLPASRLAALEVSQPMCAVLV